MNLHPLCPDPERPGVACEFSASCHESRQRLQQSNAMYGTDCWAFVQLRRETGYPGNVIEPEAA